MSRTTTTGSATNDDLHPRCLRKKILVIGSKRPAAVGVIQVNHLPVRFGRWARRDLVVMIEPLTSSANDIIGTCGGLLCVEQRCRPSVGCTGVGVVQVVEF